MDYKSLFDIIGPIMVGPSSSHTAGAAKIGKITHDLFGGIAEKAEITFYGSFTKTHKGHGTDIAIVAGLLGLMPDDERIRGAFSLAKEAGMDFEFILSEKSTEDPNTVDINLSGNGKLFVTGVSVGGGKINITNINGFHSNLSGDSPTLLVFHKDDYGAIALVTGVLASQRINLGNMENSRISHGEDALMKIEVDDEVSDEVLGIIQEIPLVHRVIFLGGQS